MKISKCIISNEMIDYEEIEREEKIMINIKACGIKLLPSIMHLPMSKTARYYEHMRIKDSRPS